ncbi:MAG TPA: hypothetical protein VFV30_07315 [Novosphingobium sp.]|nr:hypothetical protein [Novosphingobium sp.]
MNPFKLVAGFVRWLWSLSMAVRHPIDSGLRTGSASAGLYMFLFLLFLVIGLVLMALGFDLADIDRWLDANGGWIEGGADLLFRAFMGLIFLFSLLAAGVMLFEMGRALFGARGGALDDPEAQLERAQMAEDDRMLAAELADPDEPLEDFAPPEPDAKDEPTGPLGLGCGMLVALVFAYFAWFGMTG